MYIHKKNCQSDSRQTGSVAFLLFVNDYLTVSAAAVSAATVSTAAVSTVS